MSEVVEQPDAEQVPDSVVETEATADQSDTEVESEELLAQQAEDEIEDELEGLKVRGKKDLIEKLKSERMFQADYTRKTQALAEEKRAAEEVRATLAAQAKIQQVLTEDVASLKAIDRELEQYKDVNWISLLRNDPDTAEALDKRVKGLQALRAQTASAIAEKHQAATQELQQSMRTLVDKANAYLSREVKGWSSERSEELARYAVEKGIPQAALLNMTAHMPAFGVILDRAERFERLQKQAAKPKPEAQPSPVTTLTTQRARANVEPERMSTDDWMRWRRAQVKRR